MAEPKVPRFAFPMRKAGSRLASVEQDSEEEVVQSAKLTLRYARGDRTALPDFGLPDQALRENGADLGVIRATISTWDDRADAEVFSDDDLSDAIQEIDVEVDASDG
jgi:hypothetical protein